MHSSQILQLKEVTQSINIYQGAEAPLVGCSPSMHLEYWVQFPVW